jgi:hypothetical protein
MHGFMAQGGDFLKGSYFSLVLFSYPIQVMVRGVRVFMVKSFQTNISFLKYVRGCSLYALRPCKIHAYDCQHFCISGYILHLHGPNGNYALYLIGTHNIPILKT